jgi:hypothetical protein
MTATTIIRGQFLTAIPAHQPPASPDDGPGPLGVNLITANAAGMTMETWLSPAMAAALGASLIAASGQEIVKIGGGDA